MSSLESLTRELVTALEHHGVPYALGGALALGYHAPPRGTRDVDLNVFLNADEARQAFELLRGTGVQIEPEAAVARAHERGDVMATKDGIRIDIFVNSIPLHESAQHRRVRVDFGGTPIWVLSAEDLVVLKMLFYRPKDLLDVEQVLLAQGDAFDAGYARTQLVQHVGDDDARVAQFDKIAGSCRVAGPPS